MTDQVVSKDVIEQQAKQAVEQGRSEQDNPYPPQSAAGSCWTHHYQERHRQLTADAA